MYTFGQVFDPSACTAKLILLQTEHPIKQTDSVI